jgi:hypothetical protein
MRIVTEVPPRYDGAKNELRERRKPTNWFRLLPKPIHVNDGTVLFTLKDAAEKLLAVPASPLSRAAAQQIIDAALDGGDIEVVRATMRHVLFKHGALQRSIADTKS